ncbi:MAG: methyltransferase domain-containing protein [Woeseiaceae bacterium]
MSQLTTETPLHQHSGGENLEVMREARKYNHYLRQLIRRHAGDAEKALDFGAGIGTFSDSLSIPHEHVYCIEPDKSSRTFLASKGHEPYEDLHCLDDAIVDYVFTLNVLEHIEDDAAALAEIYRVLKPGGRLMIYVPAFMLLYSSMDAHVGHHRRYRMQGLDKLVVQAGFQVEKRAYTDALGFFATLAFKLFDGPEPAPLNPRTIGFYDRYLFPLSRLMSVPLARILGKNLLIVASKPGGNKGHGTSTGSH